VTPSYRTLTARVRAEPPKIQGSRHIGTAAPVADADAALAVVAEVRAEWRAAHHHAWAFRCGADGAEFRSSDDGEPSGSAGLPILRQIEAADLTHVVVVVTRIFGGTRLGVGGLMRAYGGAAGAVLAAAETVVVVPTQTLEIVHGHADAGVVHGVLARLQLTPGEATYSTGDAVDSGEAVVLAVEVPTAEVNALRAALRDASQGRVAVRGLP